MKFCLFNGLMLLAFYPIFFLYLWVNGKSLAATSSLAAALVIPLVAVILEYMAYRKINQDEQLVRSADRIRREMTSLNYNKSHSKPFDFRVTFLFGNK